MNKSQGFTIIELAVSLFVVSIAIIGIFNALSVVIVLTSDSSDRLTATYLAQEGMEIVRNIRDTNWLKMDDAAISNTGQAYSWIDGLSSEQEVVNNLVNCSGANTCKADYKSIALSAKGGDDYLYLNEFGFYVQPSSIAETDKKTKFQRRIIVEPIKDANDKPGDSYHIVKVKSRVSWDKKATVLSAGILANLCCPGDTGCPLLVSNCITAEETLYNWYNTNILVKDVIITDDQYTYPENSDGVGNNLIVINTPTHQFYAEIFPDTATNQNVTWTSMSSNVATVDNNGLVTAQSEGTAVIRVTTADGGHSKDVTVQIVSQAIP